MKTKFFVLLLALLVIMPVSYGNATSVREVSIDEMLRQCQLVFEGTVTAVDARESGRKRIRTYVTFEINEIIKGQYDGAFITLSFLGGTVGNVTMAVSDMQVPQVGEHGIYFVESLERPQVHPLYGWSQGHFIVERDSAGNGRMMTSRRLPITAVAEKSQIAETAAGRPQPPALSKGVAAEVVAAQGKAGMSVDDFKIILRGKMADDL